MTKEMRNVYQRILDIMNEVQYLYKVDKAAKGLPYKFISHDKVSGALHMPMVKHGLLALPDVIEFEQEGNRSRVKVKVRFVNADDPKDFVEVHSYGFGIDPQDKGPGKAISYATKMCYLKCFMLESGEDPERDNIDYNNEDNLINETQAKTLQALIKNDKDTFAMLSKEYGIKKITDITTNKYGEITTALKLLNSKVQATPAPIKNNITDEAYYDQF